MDVFRREYVHDLSKDIAEEGEHRVIPRTEAGAHPPIVSAGERELRLSRATQLRIGC